MGGRSKALPNPNVCPSCKRFISFDRKTGPTAEVTNINMDTEGRIVCSCGFVVSDMRDIHPSKNWPHGRGKRAVETRSDNHKDAQPPARG